MVVGREEIVAAAVDHLNRAPAASMAEIAQAAGVSRGTLHRHFSTREELIVELGWRCHAAWRRVHEDCGLDAALRGGERLAETLEALVVASIDAVEAHGFALTEHLVGVEPELLRSTEALVDREVALIEACQRAGILRADLPARWIENTLYGLLVAVRESLHAGDVARRDLPRLLLETFLEGTSVKETS
ncbi:TetR family transcriptional regulator [Actinocorallia herbida]|uniref:TetR family transcriptional regulator n=1 Tax=Actinocorallia herbida TaxID=58109 RepID=A0A3N1CVA0_9ACTN|nr:TetR/AcrR family transcriptional regulator [Actinocorallia herbida]ROO85154.1 TetR family transcriptional regulator [Actinocorallia herbida]